MSAREIPDSMQQEMHDKLDEVIEMWEMGVPPDIQTTYAWESVTGGNGKLTVRISEWMA